MEGATRVDPEQRVLDPAGAVLTNVQGRDQTALHDEVLAAIRGALEWAGAEVELEVRGVFAARIHVV